MGALFVLALEPQPHSLEPSRWERWEQPAAGAAAVQVLLPVQPRAAVQEFPQQRCVLASISTGNVLANVSGSSTYPTPTIPSAILDVIGSTQGSLLYRGGSVWSALTPGTNGQFLQTTGAGSTPQWASAVSTIAGNTGAFTLTKGITNSTNAIGLSLTNVSLQSGTLNPTGAGTTAAMMGLGSTCTMTPSYSTRLSVHIYGSASNSSVGSGTMHFRYGTGTAPTNGTTTLTGTVVGTSEQVTSGGSGYLGSFDLPVILTGLTTGTAYWFDLDASSNNATFTIGAASCSGMEF